MNTKEGIVDLTLFEHHDKEGNAFLTVKFSVPDEWALPTNDEGYKPWLTCVKCASLIKAIKAASGNSIGIANNGIRYRYLGTFKVSGAVSGRRFFINRMTPAKADYVIDKDDEVSFED